MMDDFGALIFVLAISVFASFGIFHVVVDNRTFKSITEQCEKQGYIQDQKTRIKCSVEKNHG